MGTIQVYKVQVDGSGTAYVVETVDEVLEFLKTEISEMSSDYELTVSKTEMTEKEFISLGEFDGF